MVERSQLCLMQMQALHESVEGYRKALGSGTMMGWAGYATPKNAQANKTALKRQITALRQSLLALEKEIGA